MSWELSGQGDGGYLAGEDDDEIQTEIEFGAINNRPQRALDQRKYFMDGKGLHLLYLWEVLDRHDLLSSSVQRFNEDTGVENGHLGVPSVISRRRFMGEDNSLGSSRGDLSSKKAKRNDDIDGLSKSIRDHSSAMIAAAKINSQQQEMDRLQVVEASLESRINSLRDTRRNLVIRLALEEVSSNSILAHVITSEIASIEAKISLNQEKIEKMHPTTMTTPLKSNISPNHHLS